MAKAPFGIIITAKLKPGSTISARDAAARLHAVVKNEPKASKYWGYTVGTGVGEKVCLFCPFTKYADLDRPTTGQVAVQSKAAANVDVDGLITSVESHLESVTRSIVEYVPGLSNPPTHDALAPGPFIYHVEAHLKPGNTIAARDLAAKIAEAHRKSPNGVKYWGYTTAMGSGDTYHVFIPFEKYADLDGWATTGEVLAAADAATADQMLTEIDSMIEHSQRQILSYVPGLSIPA